MGNIFNDMSCYYCGAELVNGLEKGFGFCLKCKDIHMNNLQYEEQHHRDDYLAECYEKSINMT